MSLPIEIKKLPASTVELRGEVPAEVFESFRAVTVTALSQEVKLPGFRPGHIPETVLVREIGEETVLRRMAELALNQHYPAILTENKIDALGPPSISLTKIARGNPLGFIITTAVHPEIKLPDYRALVRAVAPKVESSPEGSTLTSIIVTEEEITAVMKDLEKMPAKDQPKLPEAELRQKIKDGLTAEKKIKARDKRRLELVGKIISATTIELPSILVESEIETMLAEMKHEIGRLGLPFDQYLQHLKKTEVDLKKDWQPEATRRAATWLILAALAKTEQIEAPKAELEMELRKLLEKHPSADPERARAYLTGLIVNEQVFQFLESL